MKKALLRTAGVAGSAAAGWALYSKLSINHKQALPPALNAGRAEITSPRAGRVSYYSDDSAPGTPLVLIHSVNAAASAYEMLPLFDRYRRERPVYAPDLPGFGFSDRSRREYTPELYASAIADFLLAAIPENQPADVVALSLGGEFCARAALSRPDLFRSLSLISPTGFSSRENQGASEGVYHGFSFPLWSQPFFDLLTTPPVIRHYLQKSFEGPVDEGLARYGYRSSHQPGARHAPLYFISGKLLTPRVRERIYSRLTLPVQVIFNRDGYVNFDRLPEFLRSHPNWQSTRIAGTRGLPHFEKTAATADALQTFWRERAVLSPLT